MHIESGSGPKKCIRCLRSKEEALKEHVRLLQPCDNQECPFHDEILQAIEEEKNKPKFTIGKPLKPRFTFGTKH